MTGAWAIGARPEDCISIVDALETNNGCGKCRCKLGGGICDAIKHMHDCTSGINARMPCLDNGRHCLVKLRDRKRPSVEQDSHHRFPKGTEYNAEIGVSNDCTGGCGKVYRAVKK